MVTVEHLQLAILVTQLHQLGIRLETASGLLRGRGGVNKEENTVKQCEQTISLLNAASVSQTNI